MCRFFTVLARHDEDCQILQCEHGTVHLVWRHATVRIRPADIVALADVLERAAPTARSLSKGGIALFMTPTREAHLWLTSAGLWLDWPALELLRDLVRNAKVNLAELQTAAPEQPGVSTATAEDQRGGRSAPGCPARPPVA